MPQASMQLDILRYHAGCPAVAMDSYGFHNAGSTTSKIFFSQAWENRDRGGDSNRKSEGTWGSGSGSGAGWGLGREGPLPGLPKSCTCTENRKCNISFWKVLAKIRRIVPPSYCQVVAKRNVDIFVGQMCRTCTTSCQHLGKMRLASMQLRASP